MQETILVGRLNIAAGAGLFIMAGPCVIESLDTCLAIGRRLAEIADRTAVPLVFKASFDKANRSSIAGFRGPGMEEGLRILDKVRQATGLPVMTDVHDPGQPAAVAEVVDCLQVPAFLCRQTDLLVACARTRKCVNVKKGQFLSPAEMANVVEKLRSAGNERILLTERGTFFGYNRLVNDMTAIAEMQRLGCPVVFDATHSTQRPGGLGTASGGARDMGPVLARAAVAAGADGLFLEVHTRPEEAKSDAACIMPIAWVEPLIEQCKRIYETVRS